jgi:hypothetical protein
MAPLAGELDQAELRQIGPIAHKLGIEGDERLARRLGAELREIAGGGEQGHRALCAFARHFAAQRAALTYG